MNAEPAPKAPSRASLLRNWISLAGLVVALSSLFAFALLLTLDYFSKDESPYLGILTYLVSPAFLGFGLVLIGLGWLIRRRQIARAASGAPIPTLVIDISRPRDRRWMTIFLFVSLTFFLITAIASYQTYHVTKTAQFCGNVCHAVMEPQYVAYQNSPHARVECTACHIAPGATSFLKAKLGGLHQVYATAFDKFECPINGHDKIKINQRTCEECHWPKKFHGNLDRTYPHFLTDETNTPYSVRLLLKVGGGDPTHGPIGGIHWHMNVANKVEYIATDKLRQKIPWVRLTDTNGVVTEFRSPGFTNDPGNYTIHKMDCMDCHNRPAHHFRAPNDSVDLAMALGKIDTSLPSIKKEAVLALTAPYATKEEGVKKIDETLRAKYSSRSGLASTIAEVQNIFEKNFFPGMKTNWKLHPNNIGHKDWPGCFRCHDNEHATADKKHKINSQDCNSCHIILAEGSGAELERLHSQGKKFKHPEEGWEELKCFDCHTGTVEGKK